MIFCPSVFDKLQRIILSQWMPFPIRRQEYSPQVGGVAKLHAKQIVDFAFRPISRRPYAGYAIDAFTIGGDFQTHALITGNRVEIVDDFERSFPVIRIMRASQVGKIVKRRVCVTLQSVANFNDARSLNTNRKLTKKL